jgi:glycosyltransferase involved in cell wall biosynthesis
MTSLNSLRWAVVIPAYNESKTILTLVQQILQQQPTSVIVVNDASTDTTARLVASLPVRLINNPENRGKAGSLWAGFEHAMTEQSDVVITMDGDAQHKASDLPRFIQSYHDNISKKEKSIIIGSRKRNPESQPFARYFANRFANFWISWAAGYRISDSQSGFRLYPVELLKKMQHLKQSQGFLFESEILIDAAKAGYYSNKVDIEAVYPKDRRPSHFKPYADIKKITQMVATKLYNDKFNIPGLIRVIFNIHSR